MVARLPLEMAACPSALRSAQAHGGEVCHDNVRQCGQRRVTLEVEKSLLDCVQLHGYQRRHKNKPSEPSRSAPSRGQGDL